MHTTSLKFHKDWHESDQIPQNEPVDVSEVTVFAKTGPSTKWMISKQFYDNENAA